MTKAIQIDQFGGPEVMEWREVDVPTAGPGAALIRQEAVGLNFIDTYHRKVAAILPDKNPYLQDTREVLAGNESSCVIK